MNAEDASFFRHAGDPAGEHLYGEWLRARGETRPCPYSSPIDWDYNPMSRRVYFEGVKTCFIVVVSIIIIRYLFGK